MAYSRDKENQSKGAEGGNKDAKQESGGAEGGAVTEEESKLATEEGKGNDEKKDDGSMSLFDAFAISLGLKDEPKIESLLDTVDFDGIIKYIKDGKAKNIITMAGAGISTSAGIPDFRSPGTGLYDNLQKYNLPDPQAVFSIDYFKKNPEPFCMLSKELWPDSFKPTLCHYFVRLLADKGLLLRHYTQNIDTLETAAGLDPEKCVEAHGHFRTGHCLECGDSYTQDWLKERIMNSKIPRCESCEGLVKPDIVFFGESLPERFGKLVAEDFPKCDLLIIMGTSLVVQPFASLANRTPTQVPRLYVNLENSCPPKLDPIMSVIFGSGFDFDGENNYRDVFKQGTCDDGCQAMAEGLGWGDELKNLVKSEHARIDAENARQSKTDKSSTVSDKKKEETPQKASATPKKDDEKKTPQKEASTTKKGDTPDKKKTPQKPSSATKKGATSGKTNPKTGKSPL